MYIPQKPQKREHHPAERAPFPCTHSGTCPRPSDAAESPARPAVTPTFKPGRSFLSALLLIASLGVAQSATAANLLVNGSFETPVQGPPNYATFNIPAGSTLITGWKVVQGNVDLTVGADYTPSYDGSQAVDLIGDSTGSGGVFGGLSQTFATTPGRQYQLTFAYSHNNGTYAPIYAAQVTVADANNPANSVLSTQVSQVYNQKGYTLFSQTFVANSSSTILSFIDTQGAFNAGIYLDAVSVEAVAAPTVAAVIAPSTWALMILGLVGVGFLAHRRRNQISALAETDGANT